MNELQKVEFELLENVIRICERHNIRCYLVCGTALGAVKYNGFIPWDDDVDVAMCRKDYNEFIKFAKEELDSGIAVQNHLYCKGIPFIYTKLRMENTTFIEKTASRMDICHGVNIDVFPLDGHPDNKISSFIFEIKKRLVWKTLSSVYYRDRAYKNAITAPLAFFARRFLDSLVNYYEKLLLAYPCESSELWCNYGNSPSKLEYAPRTQYGEGVEAQFEGLRVIVPEKYDEYLTQKYGDWRADLPEDEKVGHHYAEVIDVNRPYTDYVVKQKKGKIRIKTPDELQKSGIAPQSK